MSKYKWINITEHRGYFLVKSFFKITKENIKTFAKIPKINIGEFV